MMLTSLNVLHLNPVHYYIPDLEINAGMRVYDSCQLCQWPEAVPHLHGASVSQNIIDEVVDQWRRWLHAYVKGKRHYFEYLLN